MMVATIPPVLVPKPTPSMPLRYGLFQAAVGPLELPVHARNGGLQYVNPMCGPGFGYEIECIGDQAAKVIEGPLETVTGTPFMVAAPILCGTAGFTYAEQRAFVLERLKSVEQALVEEIFSTGTFGQSPSLLASDGIATIAGGAPGVELPEVIGELEDAMYCTTQYGAPAYLHMPIVVFNALREQHMVRWDGTRWRTPMGSVVSTGCYAGNDPAGVAPAAGTFWVYATGQTTIWRASDGDVQIAPVEGSFDRTTNQMLMLAEREYVVTFECGGYAKAVTLWV